MNSETSNIRKQLKDNILSGTLNNVLVEMKNVTWPTKEEAWKLTITVFSISLIVAIYLGIIDGLLAKLLEVISK